MTRESAAEVKNLFNLFNLAEQYAKEVEILSSAVQVPAINELRYAGQHILKALVEDDGEAADTELGKAKGHCQRAMYEAVEAGIMYCLDEIKAFQEDHRGLVISAVVSDYHKLLVRAQQATDKVVEGRSDRESVAEHVEEYIAEFRAVLEIVRLFEASRDDLSAMRLERDEAKRRHNTRIVMMGLGSAIALLAAVLAFFT